VPIVVQEAGLQSLIAGVRFLTPILECCIYFWFCCLIIFLLSLYSFTIFYLRFFPNQVFLVFQLLFLLRKLYTSSAYSQGFQSETSIYHNQRSPVLVDLEQQHCIAKSIKQCLPTHSNISFYINLYPASAIPHIEIQFTLRQSKQSHLLLTE
jgi:hypothetical protein